jgi:cobalt transporter subunit CbtA
MIGRIVLAALVAGLLAGFVLAGIQQVRLTPLIAQGETYEKAADGEQPPCRETMPGMKTCGDGGAPPWQPAEGISRTLFTSAASMLAGAGYAIVLTGISLLSGVPITKGNGMIWGLCGFLAAALAPAMGLPPEVPGMPESDVSARQLWWASTIALTGLAIYLIALRPEAWAKFLAVPLLALPHLIGAPTAHESATQIPPELASRFATNSLAAAAIFWCLIGLFLGLAFERFNLQERMHD